MESHSSDAAADGVLASFVEDEDGAASDAYALRWCLFHMKRSNNESEAVAAACALSYVQKRVETGDVGAFAGDLIKSEGVSSLYAGLGAGCLRQVFYATSRYGLFEKFRDTLAQYRKTDFAQRFATASVAGGCAALISCPVEVCA